MKCNQHVRCRWLVLCVLCSLFVHALGACVRLPHHRPATASQFAPPASLDENRATPRLNINTAEAKELEELPGIGRALAARIVSHRERYGRFRRAEHLMMVRGIGDRRFRHLRPFITVE